MPDATPPYLRREPLSSGRDPARARRALLDLDTLGDGAFWRAPFGRALAWKLALVTVMLSVQAVHDFVQGPRAGRLEAGGPDAARARRRASWMARANAVLGVLLVWMAVRLGRGG